MLNKKIPTILVKDIIGKAISSREVIIEILEKELAKMKSSLVHVNFKDVEFISRSAAHELIRVKEQLEHVKKKNIEFIKLSEDVAQMIRLVAASKAYSKPEIKNFKPKKVNLKDLMRAI